MRRWVIRLLAGLNVIFALGGRVAHPFVQANEGAPSFALLRRVGSSPQIHIANITQQKPHPSGGSLFDDPNRNITPMTTL